MVYHTGTNATRGKGSHWNPILFNKYVQTELLLLLPLASPPLFHLTCAIVPQEALSTSAVLSKEEWIP